MEEPKKAGTICSYKGCPNKSYHRQNRFYSFPREVERAKLWLILCNRPDLADKLDKVQKSHRICDAHFSSRMFRTGKRKLLRKDAFPLAVPEEQGKLWIRVPAETNLRKTWLKLAKRDPHTLSTESPMYFCQDHFDLENDMVNYMEYKIMGTVKRIRMKPDCIPLRFEFQDDGKSEKHKLPPTSNELYASKKIAKMHVFSPIHHNQAQAMVGHADTNLGHEAKMLPKEEQNYVNPQLSEEVLEDTIIKEEEHSLSEFKYQQEDFFVEPSILQQPNDEQFSFEMRREIAIADIADFARTLDEENFNKFAAEMQTLKISFLAQQNSERMHKEIKIEPEET